MVTRDSTHNVLMFKNGPGLSVAECAALQLPDPAHYAPGDIVAQSKPSIDLASAIGRRIMTTGGAALFVDYGFAAPRGHIAVGDTLQAMSGHSHVGVFDRPGDVDLTIHVDFAALAVAAESAGACAWGPVNQSIFLQRLGIDVRAQQLAASADLDGRQAIAAARDRLVADDQMGTLFKVVAITGDDAPVPAGFTSDDKFE